MNFDKKIEEKLIAFFDEESGDQKSIQGELYRKYFGIMHEYHGNGSGNWEADKYGVNRKGYSVEYLVDLVQKYLDDNPDEFLDYEDYKIELLNDLPKCNSVEDVDELINQFELYEVEKTLDFSKCTTTQEQLDSASIWDEDLNWLIGHLTDNALSEWSDETKDKLRNSFEYFRLETPIGVISDESEEEWYRQNNIEPDTFDCSVEAQEFIDMSIFSWIYQNPDLINLNGNNLGTNIKEIFTKYQVTSLTGWVKKIRDFDNDLPRSEKDLTSLTTLNLGFKNLTDLPIEIFNLTNLTSLNLQDNNLTKLPKEIGNLKKLTSLKLSMNKFTKLPKEIFNLTNLTSLSLSANYFTKLPKEIGNLKKLTTLRLSNNKLTKLPKEIFNLTNLTTLILSHNYLTKLPKEIGNLKKLTYLDLDDNKLTKLPKEIGNLTNLTDKINLQ